MLKIIRRPDSSRKVFRRMAVALCLIGVGAMAPSASATTLMVGGVGTPGSTSSEAAYTASRYMGAQYARLVVGIDNWAGNFDWAGKVTPFVEATVARGLKPYLTLSSVQGLYMSQQPSVQQYASACTAAAERYNGKVYDYGVWNEPNLGGVGDIPPTWYTAYYQACRSAIKAVIPSANIYFGELSTSPSTLRVDAQTEGEHFATACEYFDQATPISTHLVAEGIGIHPYQFTTAPNQPTGTFCKGIGRLGNWQTELAHAKELGVLRTSSGGQVPLAVSEFGYCTTNPPGLPPESGEVACPAEPAGVESRKDEATRAAWSSQAYSWAKEHGVTLFAYWTVLKRPIGDFIGNKNKLLWDSGIVDPETGAWTPSVSALHTATESTATVWYLRNSNSSGISDATFQYGSRGSVPAAGDWNHDGIDTPGVFTSTGNWMLRNYNSNGEPQSIFAFGATGDAPVAGDWNADGTDSIGVFRSPSITWYLRNSNNGGPADIAFTYGVAGYSQVSGDWNGDGIDTIGVFHEGVWYLRNSNTSGIADVPAFAFGAAGDIPVAGDWNGDGIDTIGVFRPSTAQWFLRNSNNGGGSDYAFSYGSPGDQPIVGDWNNDNIDTPGVVRP